MKYEELMNRFSWEEVIKTFDWDMNEYFNAAHECCDRWADDPNRIAIYWENEAGHKETWTFHKLKEQSNRMANALRAKGIKKGDRVAGLLGKDMELYVTVLAVWKIGAVYVPLFTAFGPEAIRYRLENAGCKVLLTNQEQANKLKRTDISTELILIDGLTKNGQTFWEYINSFSDEHETEKTDVMDPCTIQYTSGSTGLPKGAVWAHKIFVSSYPFLRYGIGVEPGDRLYGGADPGWAFGLINCTFAPLSFGISILSYKGPFDVATVYRLLEEYKISNFAYAPTAFRMMMAAGPELVKKYNIQVKKFSSAGEPLNAEVVRFFRENFGREIYDQYGATETGMIVNNLNVTDMTVKPGSMGLPAPGFHIAIVDNDGNPVKKGDVGQIVVDTTHFPQFFLGYWNAPEKTESKMLGKWFQTGDLANQDEEGYFWFQGRDDDIISSAGYRIGPFEVESNLIEHPAVSEAAVVGKPDSAKGEIVKAFVVLNPSFQGSDELAKELSNFVKGKLSKHQYPREVDFVESLPKTPSGKIQRYLLRKESAKN
ncbi:acetyl-CoA synthetase [Alteribacillus persepolensis]|uniref:Acetyl-CoA synthetase n=1 Tax=Alteribacillus persepolensis TaxID=568899 RepID=A0A1G8HTK8_9BACI|nr:AMP-binding protein [Alteribacillus persepolensis]SDI09882.1 acetyl-CoA synthetase [Alteribacillus persepolensis]